MCTSLDSSNDLLKTSEFDNNSSFNEPNDYTHPVDYSNYSKCVDSYGGCVSNSPEIFELFSNGLTDDNYPQFCNLFSKNVFKSIARYSNTDSYDKNDLDSGFNYPDGNFYEYEYPHHLSEGLFWEYLEWFVNVLDELNRFESLGFGVTFLLNKLNVFTENFKSYENDKSETNLEYLYNIEGVKKWVDFINVFRDANNSIYTTYTLLEIMQMKLTHIKYKLIKVLQLKQSNTSKLMNSNFNIAGALVASMEQFENTPINTPSSTATLSDKGDNDILCEIWDEQLKKTQVLVFNKFRHYIANVIQQLKSLYPNHNYYQMIQFLVYTDPLNKKAPYGNDSATSNQKNTSLNALGNHTSTEVAGVSAIDGDDYDVVKSTESILEYLETYYSSKNMNEEKADSYVKRIIDLNKRLIPKFVRINTKLPIYYEAYLNALVCNNIQDGLFQLISSNAHNNYKDIHKDKDSYNEEGSEYKSWLNKIHVIKALNKTNLEVVDVIRCSVNGRRKLVSFTQGMLSDLFSNTNSYKDYKDTYKELYKDNIIIKNDKDSVADKDDEISTSIYFCNDNLNEVANREIEKVMTNMLPNFSWYPKLIKYQRNYQSRQNNYNYKTDNDFENIEDELFEDKGMDYIEYINLEEKIWSNRLNMFNSINERNIRNMLLRRKNNVIKRIEYDSTNLLINSNVQFKVLLDYNNYIPIKYIYNENKEADNNKKVENKKSNPDPTSTSPTTKDGTNVTSIGNHGNKNKNESDADNDWLIRLFNTNNNKIFKNRCIDIEIESDLFPGFYLFNNFKLNCFILPIHENDFQNHETFSNFSKMLQNKIDLIYPPYAQQVKRIVCDDCSDGFCAKYGDFFTTYHTNLSIGNKDKMIINLVFHLVCCDTNIDDDINPIEYAEDTEVILKHIQKMKPILNGLANILSACNRFNIQTIHIPASLKCCYKINQYNNNIIQADFSSQSSGCGHFNPQLNVGACVSSKDAVFECNNDYVRCLAVVSYLASLLNKNKYSINNFNLIFPHHLKQTLLPKTGANIFTTRVNIF